MQELKTIKKLSLANIAGLIYASIGFLSSLTFSIYSLIKFAIGKNIDKTFFAWLFTNIGLDILLSLGAALAAGIFGWISGIIISLLYNFFARNIGGIKIELTEENQSKPEIVKEIKNQDLFKY